MRESLEMARKEDGRSFTVKQIEKSIARLEEKYKKLVDVPRDPGLAFESTGIDYVIVDEAHLYKNLATPSNIPGANLDGSQKSADMHMKLTYLRQQHGERVVTMATATPIANSVTEAYVMQRYLRPDLLEDAGLHVFDQWAATFGKTVSEIEVAPTGGENFRMKRSSPGLWCNARVIDRAGDGQADRARTGSSVSGSSPSSGTRDRRQRPRRSRPR